MSRLLAVANQKGGVGKTTTSINLGASLALLGQRVLVVDLDPQGNLTSGVGQKGKLAERGTIYDALTRPEPVLDPGPYTLSTSIERLDVIPANQHLTGAEIELVSLPHREERVRKLLASVRQTYDYILIDCPPSLGLLTLNALVAADAVLIPLHCEYFALEGLADLVGTMRRVRVGAESIARHRRRAADDVRRAHESRAPGGERCPQLFQAEGISNGHPPECASRRSAEPRHAGRDLRPEVARCRGVHGARERSSRTKRRYRGVSGSQESMMDKRPALGKGLSALIPDAAEPRTSSLEIDIDRLSPSTYQPRRAFDDTRLEDLARSIKSNGVIQPIVVRRVADRFHIIAGERRWRAAQKAGLLRVPVVIRDVAAGEERSLLEMALIENVQREDLNPIDEALAYRRLTDDFHLTQDDIAAAVGKDRATVANVLRLLKLPEDVRADVAAGTLSMGHARALLALTAEADQRRLARDVIARSLSVRETESLIRKIAEATRARTEEAAPAIPQDVHTKAAEDKLKLLLGTRVRIVRQGAKGRIEIEFASEDELIRIYDHLTDGR